MSKVYFIYATIPEEIFNKRIKYFIDHQAIHRFKRENGKMYGMYAWTTSKKKLKSFLNTRNNSIYTVVKKELNNEIEMTELKRNFGSMQLDYYLYRSDTDGKELCVTTTKDEYLASVEEVELNFWEFIISDLVDVNYKIFNKEVQEALDLLDYTRQYASNCSDDEDLHDEACYNASFHKTLFGIDNPFEGYNEANILLYLFEYMFLGDIEMNEEEVI